MVAAKKSAAFFQDLDALMQGPGSTERVVIPKSRAEWMAARGLAMSRTAAILI